MKFNPLFGTLGNQIELQSLAKHRVAACRHVSAQGRTLIATAAKDQKQAIVQQVDNAERHARQWTPFVRVLPVFDGKQ